MTALATPTTEITDWITAKLAAAGGVLTGVGVHVGVATNEQPRPVPGQQGPYITIRHISSVDRYYVGGRIAGATSIFEVTAWDKGNDATRITPLAAAIQAALQQQRGAAGETYITACLRAAAVERLHTEDSPPFTQLGGEYVIRTSAP